MDKYILTSEDPVWDWSTQKWKGSFLRPNYNGCNYYDFSNLRPNKLKEIKELIIQGLCNNLLPISKIIKIRCGDLIQIGKSKNRGLFIISTDKILPITQVLGGNGFGEIPINYIDDVLKNTTNSNYKPNHWTYENHPIINHVPILNKDDFIKEGCKINGCTFYSSEPNDSILRSPYIYLDLDNNEYFTVSNNLKDRFDDEINKIIKELKASNVDNLSLPHKNLPGILSLPDKNLPGILSLPDKNLPEKNLPIKINIKLKTKIENKEQSK